MKSRSGNGRNKKRSLGSLRTAFTAGRNVGPAGSRSRRVSTRATLGSPKVKAEVRALISLGAQAQLAKSGITPELAARLGVREVHSGQTLRMFLEQLGYQNYELHGDVLALPYFDLDGKVDEKYWTYPDSVDGVGLQ